MIRQECEYSVLPYYRTQGEYVPKYSMLFYRTRKDYVIHALKVRTDVVVEKIWREAVQKELPPELLKTNGMSIFSYPVENGGEVNEEIEGFLLIHDGKVIGIRNGDPRAFLPSNEVRNYCLDWREGREPKFILLDYEEDELFSAMRTGWRRYKAYWEKKEEFGKI